MITDDKDIREILNNPMAQDKYINDLLNDPNDPINKMFVDVKKKYGLRNDNVYPDTLAKLKEVILDLRPSIEDNHSHILWAVAMDILDRIEVDRRNNDCCICRRKVDEFKK